ncbi:unnamed protein product [Mytilus coruscus]|uniref:Peptidase A2 domain-containing protein n=1 Tax=Mytilus coruscus TaxID=42192 RepID=A0A6J8DTZ2_MYTCO|nr:unnamed protein product [Mytilus coruscus]
MNTAGKGMQMNEYVVGPVNLEIGSKLIQSNLYVNPIEDDMLLGFDLLRAHCIDLQMSEVQLRVREEVIPMTMGKVERAPRVANVTLREKVMVPPNSVMKISCHVYCELPSYIVEAGTYSGLLVPRTLHAGGSQPVVCLINTSDMRVHVRQGELTAQAVEVDKIEVPARIRVVCTGVGTGPPESDQGVPEHLRELFGRSKAQAQWSKFVTGVDDVVPLASFRGESDRIAVNEVSVVGSTGSELDPCISRVTVAFSGRDVVIILDNPECSVRVVQEGLGVVLGKYSVDQIREGQGMDPDFGWLLNWLDDNDYKPSEGELFRSSPMPSFIGQAGKGSVEMKED